MTIADPRGAIRESGLFDDAWYLARYPDVALLGMDPVEHWLCIGARLGRSPGPAFDTAYYLATYPDVGTAGADPLLHYLEHGRLEGRRCRPLLRPVLDDPGGTPADEELAAGILPVNRIPGRRPRDTARPLVLVCAHVSGQHLFGSERSLIDILDGLIASGHDVITTVPGSRAGPYQDAIRDRSAAVLSFRYDWWRKGVAVNEACVATIAALIEEYGIDAVHANTIMLREPLLAARRMNVPGLVHVREIITHDQALVDLIGLPAEEIVRRVLDSADHVIANSEATARLFHKPGATHVVPNTIDTDLFDIPALDDEGEVRISLVSSNLPKKGILDFVEIAGLVAPRAPRARFVLVGPENDLVRDLRAKQADGAVPPNVEFAGYREDPVATLADAHVVANFSHFQESFGRTVLEAMAARRPVVAYAWGALTELVTDGVHGRLVPFRDVAAAADAIVSLCADPALRARMGEAGRAKAVAGYGKAAYARKLGAAYAAVLADAAGRPRERLVLPARRGLAEPVRGPMRIAYFLWHFPVPSETFVLNELRILVEQGHDVEVFCRQSPYKDFVPDFPVRWTRVADPEALAAKLRETDRQVVHSHFTYPTVTEMVWPACELADVPFTFIAHAQDIFRHSNDEKNRIGDIGKSPLCLRVLVPSRFHRDYVVERGVPAGKVLINPNGIDPALYASAIDPARARRPHRAICAIHRFTAKKGLEHLIEAGPALRALGVSVNLYGYGDLEDAYRQRIADLGLDNVHLHGPVEGREAMLEVFSRHDLFACPSVRAPDGDMDGIPTVLMEAMAAGVPVLTSAISGIPDLVQDGVNGLLCEPTAAGIAAAVQRFYAMSDAHVGALIEDAVATIGRDFHVGRLTAALLRLWRGETVDVIIVSWNNLPELAEVVRRLYRYTMLPFHLVICDNDSRSDVLHFLLRLYASRDNVTVILNRANAFVGPGTNVALAHGRADYAVYVCGKEGFVLDYGWEKPLLEYMDDHPDVGLAGTLCYSPTYLYGRQYPEQIALFPKFRNPEFATANPDRKFAHVQGGFFVMRRAMVDAIGGFSDEVAHNYTDVEYSYYAESRGWKLGQAPRMLALFNKTRPGLLARIDDDVRATHPPTLQDLPLLDRIARREGAYCAVCGWYAPKFEAGPQGPRCESCGSSPADRSLFRFLAASTLTYRRLPALGVNIGPALDAFWRFQFQIEPVTGAELREEIARAGKLRFNDRRVKVVCLRGVLDGGPRDEPVMREVARVLADDGLLIVQPLARAGATPPPLPADFAARWGFASCERVRYASVVGAPDPNPLYLLRRVEADLCVS